MSYDKIIQTEKVLVRIMELAKGASTDWHHHTEVADFFVCLTGVVRIETKNPDDAVLLHPGNKAKVESPQIHRVVNLHINKSEYLLVQGVGAYDFIKDVV